MEFKIDTKPSYTTITPVSNMLDANLTEAILQKWKELTESGSRNIIVDLRHCTSTDEKIEAKLVALHEEVYEARQSLVFVHLAGDLLAQLKGNEDEMLLNIVPTEEEAIDIISMEVLERDLFEEGF